VGRGGFGRLGGSPHGANNIPAADQRCRGMKSSEHGFGSNSSRVFLCVGRDAAEPTAEQKKRGRNSLVCTKFEMESKLHSTVRKNNHGIWG